MHPADDRGPRRDQAHERQKLAAASGYDIDIFGFYHEGPLAALNLFHMRGGRVVERVQFVQDVQVLGPDDTLVIYAGKRHLNLKAGDLEHYFGERGRRGAKLPRGFQNVDVMTVEAR